MEIASPCITLSFSHWLACTPSKKSEFSGKAGTDPDRVDGWRLSVSHDLKLDRVTFLEEEYLSLQDTGSMPEMEQSPQHSQFLLFTGAYFPSLCIRKES